MDITQQYLDDLKDPDPETRKNATQKLWMMRYREAGEEAENMLQTGTEHMNNQRMKDAEEAFNQLLMDYPDFPEAHNKLATLLFLKGRYAQSVSECEETLKMNPNHFGAWNGLGMCLYKLLRYEDAIKCFEKTLKIQPYADINRTYIARCRGKLN